MNVYVILYVSLITMTNNTPPNVYKLFVIEIKKVGGLLFMLFTIEITDNCFDNLLLSTFVPEQYIN